MSDILTVLELAKSYIQDEKHWLKDSYAQDKDHILALWDSDDAVCFCTAGAVKRASFKSGISYYSKLANLVMRVLNNTVTNENIEDELTNSFFISAILYNDSKNTTHQDIINMFDKTIQSLKDKEKDNEISSL